MQSIPLFRKPSGNGHLLAPCQPLAGGSPPFILDFSKAFDSVNHDLYGRKVSVKVK